MPDKAVHYDEEGREKSLFGSMAVPKKVTLKKGALVMAVDHLDQDVVVGVMGEVVGFATVTKIQAQQQARNAVPQQRAIQSLVVDDLEDVCPHEKVPLVRFFLETKKKPSPEDEGCKAQELPPEKEAAASENDFAKPTQDTSIRTVLPKVITVEDSQGNLICCRTQLPLLLGYAVTVHRAQGLTLDNVCLHADGLFAYGQLYTALSRAGDFQELSVTGSLTSGMKCADPVVIAFEEANKDIWIDIENGPK